MAKHRTFELDEFDKAIEDDSIKAYFTKHVVTISDDTVLTETRIVTGTVVLAQ
jgi:hypothetical protein